MLILKYDDHVLRGSYECRFRFYWGLTPQQQPGSYQGGEMMMMKSVFWWRKPEYPEETTDLRQVTDETFHTHGLCPVQGLNLGRSGVKQSELRRDESGALAHPWLNYSMFEKKSNFRRFRVGQFIE